MKIIKLLLLALGFGILFYTLQSVGLGAIAAPIQSCGLKLLPILAVYPFIFAFNALGWKYAFAQTLPRSVSFSSLYGIRIIGETFNAVVPFSASLGGEPLKVELLKRRHGVPASEGYASILIVHTTFWVSLNLFVLGGIALTLRTLPLTPILWKSVIAFLGGLGLAAVLLIIGLHLGVFEKVHALGESFKWWSGEHSARKKEHFLELDSRVKKFFTHDPRKFFLSTVYNFLAWLFGVFEVYWMANLLGIPIGFFEAWLLEALIQVLRIVTFFIPASVGVQEGGILLIFEQFGFAHPVSLAFAILRRAREILWIGVGLLLWSVTPDKPASVQP